MAPPRPPSSAVADDARPSMDETRPSTADTRPSPAESIPTLPTPPLGPCDPPPEKPADIRRRRAVILSFWLIVALLGLPIWWYTTSIYRASLPLDAMMEWADGNACRPVFPLHIAVDAGDLPATDATRLVRLVQETLDGVGGFAGHDWQLALTGDTGDGPADTETNPALTVRLTPSDTATHTATLDPLAPVMHVAYAADTTSLAAYVAAQLRATFAEEQAVMAHLLAASSVRPDSASAGVAATASHADPATDPTVADAVARRTMRSLKYAPTYHLTFSLFTGGASPSQWDIEAAVAQYMQPVLDVLAPLHNFTMDTQVQLYAAPGVAAPVLASKQDLSSFINAAEWPLSPSIGGAPTINFIVYVGNQTISASGLGDTGGTGDEGTARSWLIPQWGSVYLLASDGDDTVPADRLRVPLLTFTAHLLSLLGTPASGSLPLRLSALVRIRTADLLLRAASTLGSLARLSLALANIAIPQSVAEGVASTLLHLRHACTALGTADGLAHARVAEAEAERAFFEKSMVGQLYFPDEHKVAVYLPLLGPVGVPLVMGLVNELKAWLRRRKERAALAKSEKKTQ